MDTTKLEYTAEDLIAHVLQRSNILVAKPKFDREGADLLAFDEFSDGVKFCRIQCKGRTLLGSSSSNVQIPASYVTPAFIVFLFVDDGNYNETNLFCFFSTDIEQWPSNGGNYVLSLSGNTFRQKLNFYKFDSTKTDLIKNVIKNAESKGEFRKLVYGQGALTLSSVEMVGVGEVGTPKA